MSEKNLIAEASRIVSDAFIGILTTVDADGVPHSRWMGTSMGVEGVGRLYCLSGAKARKIDQIHRNPNVTWVFTTRDYRDVVTLYGQAVVLDSPIVAQHVWDRLTACTKPYVMSTFADDDDAEMTTIETVITRGEVISPRMKIHKPEVFEVPAH